MRKPSVNQAGTEWVLVDMGFPPMWFTGPKYQVEAYRQETEESILDHYRLKVDGKWIRKTFYGETAWMDVERYAIDKFSVVISV